MAAVVLTDIQKMAIGMIAATLELRGLYQPDFFDRISYVPGQSTQLDVGVG